MIDWYLLLFIAFTLVILLIDKIGSHRSAFEYTDRKEIGLSGGTYSLVIPYMTGATFLFPFFFTLKGGASSFFIFTLSPIILYLISRKMIVNQEKFDGILPDQMNFQDKKSPIVFLIFGISSIGSILIQSSLIVMLFKDVLHQPVNLGVFLFLIFCYVLFGLGGRSGVNKVGGLLLIGILFTISFTVLTLYLRTGTGVVYQQIVDSLGGIFSGSLMENFLYFLTFILVIAGQTFTSFYFWESVKAIRPKHRISALRYSAFSWIALLLSFTGFSMYLLSHADTLTALKLMESLIQSNSILSHIFIYVGISMFAVGTGHSTYSLLALFLSIRTIRQAQKSTHHILKQGYLFGIMILIIIGLTSIPLSKYLTEWLPYFLSFFSAAAVPFIYVLMKKHFTRRHFTFTVGVMSVAGFALSVMIADIWLIAPVTAALTFVVHFIFTKFI